MEDKKRKKEDKRKRETSQKVVEQKNKVPELTKIPSAQSPAIPSLVSPSPGPISSTTSSTATPAAGAPPQGGNNAKRSAVANGQPSPSTQAPQRYMPREVPPRFRCQQDHKVLLKRGQPPLSSMLLGGGNSGGDSPNATVAAASDSSLGSGGPAASSLPHTSSSSLIAASSTTTNYANSMWGVSSGSQPLSQGREKVIVDGSDLEEWPSIAAGDGARTGDKAVSGGADGNGMPNCSASWGERQQPKVIGGGNEGGKGVSSVSSSPSSSSCSTNECMQPSSVVWGSQAATGGNSVAAGSLPSVSKTSPLSGTECSIGVNCGFPGANFNPNANPSAWPALVPDGAGAAAKEGGSPPLQSSTTLSANNSISVNQATHQQQLHQMQYRDIEASCRDWGGTATEPGPKNTAAMDGSDGDCGSSGGGDLSASSSSSTSSNWRAQPFPANSKTGASRTDAWEVGAGGNSASADGGNSWGFSGQDDRGGPVGGSTWGTGTQGAWTGGVGEWGNPSSVGNPSVENRDGSSSNSSTSGGSAGNPSFSASTTSTMTRAWDNQKGSGDGGTEDSNEWGGQVTRGEGGGTSSSSGGGTSKNGNQHHGHHRSYQPPNAEVALQNMLKRPDLDPRVLSNSGWGQTQIRQNVAWDLEVEGGAAVGARSSVLSHDPPYSTVTSTTSPSSSSLHPGQPQNTNLNSTSVSTSKSVSPNEGWDNSSSSSSSGSSSLPNRGPQTSANSIQTPGVSQPVNAVAQLAGGQNKSSGGWGELSPSEGQGRGWGSEGPEWRDHSTGGGAGGWGDIRQQGTQVGCGEEWGKNQDKKGTGGWNEMGRGDGGNWGKRIGSEWGGRETKGSTGNWGDGKDNGGTCADSEVGTWGSWEEGTQKKVWGAGGTDTAEVGGAGDLSSKAQSGWGGNVHTSQMPNSQLTSLKGQAQQQQQSQPQQSQSLDTGAMQGGWGRQVAPSAPSQSSGWTTGPMPQIPSGPGCSSEPSGWEEPSPQSISRKKEIDDGTSAWGDPNNYNYVNYWDKNGGSSGQAQPVQTQQQGPPSMPGRMPTNLGNRDISLSHSSSKGPAIAPSGWGRSGSPSSPCVDNGTAAWGKPVETATSWGDSDDAGNTSGWGNPPNPIKSGSKSMQEGWNERESSVSASRHSSWEEEDEGGVVWNSAGSQGSSSSYNSGGWGGKKANKGSVKGGDSWMNPMTRQFSNMGLMGDDPSGRPLDLAPGPPQDKKMDGDKRGIALNDYNGEMRKGGRGGGGGVFRSPGSKEVGPAETGPYYDKQTLPFTNQDGCLGEEGPCSPYSPPTVFKPSPLYNHPNPPRQVGGHIFGSGGGMSQPRHQPGMSPINPTVRAQVPHQFLSPQVPGSVLKQMPPPSGGVGAVGGGVFPPQLSPQHIAMLSSIYPPHIQIQLACQLLLQQHPQQQQQQQPLLPNQRKFPQNVRQQADPQQLARIMAVLQQQRQQQQQVGNVGGSSKLSPSHLGSQKMPMSDSLSQPGMGGAVADLHQKSSPAYSGFSSGVNLSGLELGSMAGGPGSLKESGGQQSRFKWMMEGHSPSPSSPDDALHKNGPITTPLKRGGSPYSQYDILGTEGLGGPLQGSSDNWQRTPGNKMGTKTGTSSWPPEFQPGVPWKGIQSVDPESDPYMTPGSMLNSSAVSSLSDPEHRLLRDNTESNPSLNTLLPSPGAWPYSASDSPLNNAHNSAKYTEYKPSWPPEPIGHNKPWKTNRNSSQLPRPPPGLTNQKQPSVSPWAGGTPRLGRGWGGSGGSQDTRYGSGSAWSDGGASRGGSCWLLLSNLTPQIDGSTLRTICMQHGPLLTFHLGLTQGSALIRYSTRQEAAKAQSALHMCVLGNTTILAEFVSEDEVARYFAHSQCGSTGGGGPPGAAGSSGVGAVGTVITCSSGERERAGGGSATTGGGGNGGGVVPAGSSWQSLDGTGGSPDPVSVQSPGLHMFAQWSNGAGGSGASSNVAGVEPGRQGLWAAMPAGYPSSSLWGSPALEDRHQMSSPAALLPGDLLGGGSDSL